MKNSKSHFLVLGVKVDLLTMEETLKIIEERIAKNSVKSPLHIVTAYSEFFVTAKKDPDFFRILNNADLVLPDGVGPLAANDYQKRIQPTSGVVTKVFAGLTTGKNVLQGRVGQTVSGVALFKTLISEAAQKNWRVFFLGGFGDVAEELAKQYQKTYPSLQVGFDSGEQRVGSSEIEAQNVLKTITDFAPDLLFVCYGPVTQEKWIARNKDQLQTKVVMGAGGTFDEVSGRVAAPPEFMGRMGLKWLGRLLIEPKRFRRILRASIVFPWLVFRQISKS